MLAAESKSGKELEARMGTKPKGNFTPGTLAPASGQVTVPGSGVEVTVVQGKPMPPTPKPNHSIVYTDLTKHRPKKSR